MEQEQQRVTRLAQQQQQRQKQNQQQQQSCDYSLSQDAIYKVFTYLNSNSLYASEEGDSTGAADKLLDDAARSGSSSRSSCISGENSMLYAEIGAAEHDRDGDEDDEDEDDEYDDRTPDEGKEEEEEEKEAEQELETRYILEEMKYSDARRAICSVCRYSLGRAGTGLVEDFERALLCSDGHLLCHRCVQKLAVKSDTNCLLCSVAESRASMSTSASLPPPRNHNNNNNNDSSNSSSGDSGRLRGGTSETLASTTTKPVAHRSSSGARAKKGITPPAARRVVSRGPPPQPQPQPQQQQQQPQHRRDQQQRRAAGTNSIINAQTLSECSRRPIQCPRLDCAVNVAFSALANHFMFDHPEVPILGVDPGERSTFIFDYDDLDDDSSRCLALLLVSNKLSGPAARQFNGMHVHPRYKNRLPLPLLAARLATCYGSSKSDSAEVRNSCGVENEAVVHRSIDDVVIAWVAGLDIGSSANVTLLRYSVQAFDVVDDNGQECGGGRSLTYTGPINSLRTAQRPREVFLTGDCVILHAGFIRHVTSRDCRNININVVVH
ncbi:uncharacterized protein LOC106654044 [Trichogramma pretiosum]|uniref:uncharacterized protein LOC106654044 n=1 Tax=Trichogramma pretiosum TaxID=7493 RepID=UPI0006C95D50|nr:uncharacterized protein LOC106654044 [Trichogramma pretiosum]